MDGKAVRTRRLCKTYGGTTRALKGVNLAISKGEWVSIVGPSGSGKTTLLNLISCLDRATSGKVELNGAKITEMTEKQLTRFRRENVGLIFQQYHLIPYLSALENVMLAQYYHSIEEENEAKNVLERVGLGHRIHHIPAHLSGGEQQRVAIARALVNEPKILLADEPTGNLDLANGRKVMEHLAQLHGEGHTVIVVTHNPEIAGMAQRTIELVDGRVAV